MNKGEILEFLNKNPIVYMATCEGKKPHVRGMLLYRSDDNGIIFHTGKSKELHKQLELNPEIELCSFSQKENRQVRVSGKAELIEDVTFKEEIVANRPFMKPWIAQYGLDILSVWRIVHGKACVWTMETNFAPKDYIQL